MVETIGAGGPIAHLGYVMDNGDTCIVRTSLQNATALGATPVLSDAFPPPPRGLRLRHVYGKASTGERAKLPIIDFTDTKFFSGGTFVKFGLTFTITGKIGESRLAS